MTTTLENLLLNDRGIAFDPASGDTYRLIGPAVQLVRLLQKGTDDDALLRYLLEEYDVDESTARRDLDVFLGTLEQMKLWEAAP
ncbi:MAG TPA: HPr-rel-A system PqqD family peptide chaperone [Candidatus Methylacidiphilales bacterium]|nr:HPr-rel-A system PqqD family peptide chaperone [Candidatus Methylacidiphilales bacterium]